MSVFSDLASLTHSSLTCGGQNVIWLQWVADSLAHIGIAGIAASLMVFKGAGRGWFFGLLVVAIGKELMFDLPNAGWSTIVWWDSAWDILCWVLGWSFQWGAMSAIEGREVRT